MKSPLQKRIFRGMKKEGVKYICIFLFLTLTISIISGFLIGSNSLVMEYNESYEKYNIEWGHFTLKNEASDELIEKFEKEDIEVYKDYCLEYDVDFDINGTKDADVRIFADEREVNGVCLWEGRLPEKNDEIALDRLFMKNNNVKIDDTVKVGEKEYKIVGIISLPDYLAIYWDNTGFMFDSQAKGTGVLTKDACAEAGIENLKYYYEWKYNKEPADDAKESEVATELMESIYVSAMEDGNKLTGFVPRYANQSITFVGDDLSKDRPMMTVLGYILIIIMGFIFAVTINQQIDQEANVIGTLRASGYTKGEIYRNYIASPMIVIVLAGIVGNIIAYGLFQDLAAELYLNSYSTTKYTTHPDYTAFLLTTVVPIILMFVINTMIIWKKLSFSPLKFLRRDLKKKQREKAIKLNTRIPIMHRFRMRIIFQNMGSYITLFIGILFSTLLLIFGEGFPEIVDRYSKDAIGNMPCKYQYVLQYMEEVPEDKAEKYAVTSLEMVDDFYNAESISIYGIQEDSKYFKDMEIFDEGVTITSDFADKYSLKVGDIIVLKEKYKSDLYAFEVKSIFEYPTSLNIYMSIDYWNKIFEDEVSDELLKQSVLTGKAVEDLQYYNGYFSNEELEGEYLTKENVMSVVDENALTTMSRQLDISMGDMMKYISGFSVIIFLIVMFMLTKLILEKNAVSISLTKILGYSNGEISGLYIISSVIVVIISAVASLAINYWFLKVICRLLFSGYTGWFTIEMPFSKYVMMFFVILGSYLLVAITQFIKIKKIPMDVALKNVE